MANPWWISVSPGALGHERASQGKLIIEGGMARGTAKT